MLLVVLAGAELVDAAASRGSEPHGVFKQDLNGVRLAASLGPRDDPEDVSRLGNVERVQHACSAVVSDVDDSDIFGSEAGFSLAKSSKPAPNGGDGAKPTYRNDLKDGFVEARIALLMELKQGSVELLAERQSRRRRVCEMISRLGPVRSSIGLLAVRFDNRARLEFGEGFGLGRHFRDRLWRRKFGTRREIDERSRNSQVAYRHLAMHCALHVIRLFRDFFQLSHCAPQALGPLGRALLGGIGEHAEGGSSGDEPSRGLIIGEFMAVLARSIGRQHVQHHFWGLESRDRRCRG
jgi:hypothetical protein